MINRALFDLVLQRSIRLKQYSPCLYPIKNYNRSYTVFARKHALISVEKNILFTWIPKVACTTMKRSFLGINTNSKTIDIHNESLKNYRATKNASINNLRKFCLIREPKSRLLSCFLEKIVDVKFSQLYFLSNYFSLNGLDIASLYFSDYIEALCYLDNLFLDSHWAPQSGFLLANKKDYSLYKLENIEGLFSVLSSSGFKLINDQEFTSPDGTTKFHSKSKLQVDPLLDGKKMTVFELLQANLHGCRPPSHSFWTKSLEEKVNNMYKQDFLLYNLAN